MAPKLKAVKAVGRLDCEAQLPEDFLLWTPERAALPPMPRLADLSALPRVSFEGRALAAFWQENAPEQAD